MDLVGCIKAVVSPRSRRLPLLLAALGMTWPAVASPPHSGRIVWHETHDTTHRGPYSHASNHAEYRIVEERDTAGVTRKLAHTLSWVSEGAVQKREVIMVRGGTSVRSKHDYSISCSGGGSFDFGTDRASIERAQREIQAAATRCSYSHSLPEWMVFDRITPGVWRTPALGKAPISWEQLGERCEGSESNQWSESKTWTDADGTYTDSRHIWVSQLEAVVEIEPADAEALKDFVPEPGRWLAISVHSNVPTLFRFELDGVSRYPGFATNANVDAAFFLQHPRVAHLSTRYQHDDPDFIFDPRGYEGERAWKWNGWTSVETTTVSNVASVFVTAMDYAAWGRLRVLARGECGGRYEPAEIRMGGRRRGFLVLPIDENDDLMADALPEYAGDPGRDDEVGYVDADFPEHAKRGDGLTAFEEYRGFQVRGTSCSEPKSDGYVRTSPKRRDLFVNATHPALARPVEFFSDTADLDPHLICARHYIDNETRVVNGTQQPGPRSFRGYLISQSEPQHGLLLEDKRLDTGILGSSVLGPPKNVRSVQVDLDKIYRAGDRINVKILHTVSHELGHALGIQHHGDGNPLPPIVLLDLPSCRYGMREGLVSGKTACEVSRVAFRNAETSGDQYCPMKYAFWSWYLPPGSELKAAGDVEFIMLSPDGGMALERRAAYRLVGTLARYETDQDSYGLASFCDSQTGTGVNALPKERNHAGNSRRICAAQLRVNDVR